MSVVSVIAGIITGIAIALLLNNLLANKIGDKKYRLGLKVAAYIVCIVLCTGFALLGSLRTLLDNFITDRIEFIEVKLTELSPGSNILEKNIETRDWASIGDELQQLTGAIDISNDGFLESMIYNAFLKKLTGYIDTLEKGMGTITAMADENGSVTIKVLLYSLKDMTLKTISPYFFVGQTGIIVLLVLYTAIYGGIVIFLKKGGGVYNKSIVFGDSDDKNNKEA